MLVVTHFPKIIIGFCTLLHVIPSTIKNALEIRNKKLSDI